MATAASEDVDDKDQLNSGPLSVLMYSAKNNAK